MFRVFVMMVLVGRVVESLEDDGPGTPLYLTPLIEQGMIDEARELSKISDSLPGLENKSQPEMYSGFLTVKQETGSNMFFWFIPATVITYVY